MVLDFVRSVRRVDNDFIRLDCSLHSFKRSIPDPRPDLRRDDQTASVIKELIER